MQLDQAAADAVRDHARSRGGAARVRLVSQPEQITSVHRAAARGDDLEHGTNAAYVHGCVQRVSRTPAGSDGSESEAETADEKGANAHLNPRV